MVYFPNSLTYIPRIKVYIYNSGNISNKSELLMIYIKIQAIKNTLAGLLYL